MICPDGVRSVRTNSTAHMTVIPRAIRPTAVGCQGTACTSLEASTVRWNAQQVPFIEAQTDKDAAYALGLVHAHLRLGQMATLRRILQGRISESAGPFTIRFDHAIRTFGFYRSADEVYAALPKTSRDWFDSYVLGINDYTARLRRRDLPHEFRLLNIKREPWTPQDSIAFGRASGVDLNWEYPDSPADVENLGFLIEELDVSLSADNMLLTCAVGRREQFPSTAYQHLDWINMMAYDRGVPDHATFDDALYTLSMLTGQRAV